MGCTHYMAVLHELGLFPYVHHYCISQTLNVFPDLETRPSNSARNHWLEVLHSLCNLQLLLNPIIWYFFVEAAKLSLEQVDSGEETHCMDG
jgi:hypothetical protein